MNNKIIALNKVTAKESETIYRNMLNALTQATDDISDALSRLNSILFYFQKDEYSAILRTQKEINYIEASLNACATILNHYDIALKKYSDLATINASRRTLEAINEKRQTFLHEYNSLSKVINSLLDFFETENPKVDISFNVTEKLAIDLVDYQESYEITETTLTQIKTIIASLRDKLGL